MEHNGGSASWQYIYQNIDKYYPAAKASQAWKEGLRGVLYRELRKDATFKKIGLSIYALKDYVQEKTPQKKYRVHSFMEGLCLELGNAQNFDTFTADPSQLYRDNTYLKDIATSGSIPKFTYDTILNEVKYIDVLWFDRTSLAFPQFAFEIVDSIGTLTGALNRCFQLSNFRTKCFIVAPDKHRTKFDQTLQLQIYTPLTDFVQFKTYEEIKETYRLLVEGAKGIKWLL